MEISPANVADILRCHQRDTAFINDIESHLHSFLQYLNGHVYNKIRNSIPIIAHLWYYYLTSLGNIQTLGEEYTGTIRFTNSTKIPNNNQQLLWLILYLGEEPLFNRILQYSESQILHSPNLTQHAKDALLKFIKILKTQKVLLQRIHHSLFYISGKYYNISNRFTGIRYVLLRNWMKNDSFTGSFKLLGKLSLFYILFDVVQTVLTQGYFKNKLEIPKDDNNSSSANIESSKICILCTDNLKNATATPCGHIFCWDCLYDSLQYQKNCPICREIVLPNRIVYLQNNI